MYAFRRRGVPLSSAVGAASAFLTPPTTTASVEQRRCLSVRTEDFFSKEAMSHARRVSWSPHTTDKKTGAFAKLARSNFTDPLPETFGAEPYAEEEMEAYRSHHRQDIYIYRYNVSPTHLGLRG